VVDRRRQTRDGGGHTFSVMWVSGLLRRRRLRLAGAALGVALAVAFLASLGAFFAASKARMTREAVIGVPVAWQVQLAPGTNPAQAEGVISTAPGVVTARQVEYADSSGFQSSAGGSVQTTGTGKVLGLPPGYGR